MLKYLKLSFPLVLRIPRIVSLVVPVQVAYYQTQKWISLFGSKDGSFARNNGCNGGRDSGGASGQDFLASSKPLLGGRLLSLLSAHRNAADSQMQRGSELPAPFFLGNSGPHQVHSLGPGHYSGPDYPGLAPAPHV